MKTNLIALNTVFIVLLSRLHRAAYEAITAVNEAAPIKPDLKAVLNLLDDCFKEAFGRSFSPSISGLSRSVSALLFPRIRYVARYAP